MRISLFDVHCPDQLAAQGFAQIAGKPLVGFGFEPGVVMIGVGMIIGSRVSLSMLAASAPLYVFIAPWLHGLDAANAGVAGYVVSIPAVRGGGPVSPGAPGPLGGGPNPG